MYISTYPYSNLVLHSLIHEQIQNSFDSCQTETQFLQSSINLQTGKKINVIFISTMVFCFKQLPPVILLQYCFFTMILHVTILL